MKSQIKKIYMIGIGGIGISGLAKILHLQGNQVSGSDLAETEITEELRAMGIPITLGQKEENIPSDADSIIFSDAVPEENPERRATQKLKKPETSYYEALAELMSEYEYPIAVSGTHGKTTTTAMMAIVLLEAGYDPTVLVGSKIRQWNSNARLGKDKKYIVVEACEHREHMLRLSPKAILLTNIEEDHLDYYRDITHIQMAFQNFINKLPPDGVLIQNADDAESHELGSDRTVVSYGIENKADVVADSILFDKGKQKFRVGVSSFTLQIPGRFNVLNALAVIACARQLGIKDDVIAKALSCFEGTWRRFELVGTYRNIPVVSDYAHHPTAVRSVLKAAKEFFPGKRLLVVFQPHQHNRTKKLFQAFTACFDDADFLILLKIYDVPGREEEHDRDVTSLDLVRAVEARGKYVFYSENFSKARQLIDEFLEKDQVLFILGAGDVYLLANELCGKK